MRERADQEIFSPDSAPLHPGYLLYHSAQLELRPSDYGRQAVFAEPTENDYLAWIRWHLGEASERLRQSICTIKREHAAKGSLQSGATIHRFCEEAKLEFVRGVDQGLGELARTIRETRLNRDTLRRLTYQELRNFAAQMKSLAEHEFMRGILANHPAGIAEMERKLNEIDTALDFRTRQFDVGLFKPDEPERPPMTNNVVNVGSMQGSSVVQDSRDIKVSFSVNIAALNDAIKNFENAAVEAKDGDLLRSVKADIAAIKAQLSKSTPSSGVLRECGRSMRTIAENAAAGALSPQIVSAIKAIAAILGA